MKITLSSQKKQTFEVEIEPSTTILDLKKLIIDHFGFPEDSISKISIVVKQIIVRDISKTLLDLNIAEGSLIYYFAPSKLVPTKTPADTSKPAPTKPSQTQQTPPPPQYKPEPQRVSSPPSTSSPKSENISPKPPSSPEDFHWPKPSTSSPKSNSYSSAYPAAADPNMINTIKEMGFDDRHATIFLRASLNNLNFAMDMITNPFYQNEANFDRLELLVNGQLTTEEMIEFQREAISSQCKEKGLNPSQAEAQMKLFDFFANLSIEQKSQQQKQQQLLNQLQQLCEQHQQQQQDQFTNIFNQPYQQQNSSQNQQAQQLVNLWKNLLQQHQQQQQQDQFTNIFNQPYQQPNSSQNQQAQQLVNLWKQMLQQHQQQDQFTNIFNQPFQQQNSSQNQQAQQLANLWKQMYQHQQQNYLNQTTSIFHTIENILTKLRNVESVPIDQYENPFIEMRQFLIDHNSTSISQYKAADTASRFNRDQVIFVSHSMPGWEEAISVLVATDGDIDSARAILQNGR